MGEKSCRSCNDCSEFRGECSSCELRKEGEESCNCCGRPGRVGLLVIKPYGAPSFAERPDLLESSQSFRLACTRTHDCFAKNIFKLVGSYIID